MAKKKKKRSFGEKKAEYQSFVKRNSKLSGYYLGKRREGRLAREIELFHLKGGWRGKVLAIGWLASGLSLCIGQGYQIRSEIVGRLEAVRRRAG